MRELEEVAESFRRTLQSMMHSRVAYPGGADGGPVHQIEPLQQRPNKGTTYPPPPAPAAAGGKPRLTAKKKVAVYRPLREVGGSWLRARGVVPLQYATSLK